MVGDVGSPTNVAVAAASKQFGAQDYEPTSLMVITVIHG